MDRQVDVVDGGDVAEPLRDAADLDGGARAVPPLPPPASAPRGRAARTLHRRRRRFQRHRRRL